MLKIINLLAISLFCSFLYASDSDTDDSSYEREVKPSVNKDVNLQQYELAKIQKHTDYQIISRIDNTLVHCHKIIISKCDFFNKAIDIGMNESDSIELDYSGQAIKAIIAGIYGVSTKFNDYLKNMDLNGLLELVNAFHFINEIDLRDEVEKAILKLDLSSKMIKQVFFLNYKYFSSYFLIKITEKILSSTDKNRIKLAKFISSNLEDPLIEELLSNLTKTYFKDPHEFFYNVYKVSQYKNNNFYFIIKKFKMFGDLLDINLTGDRILLSDNYGENFTLNNINVKKPKAILKMKKEKYFNPFFTPDGQKLILANSSSLDIYDANNGQLLAKKKLNFEFKIESMLVTLDSAKLFVKLKNGSRKIFDMDTLDELNFSEENMVNVIHKEIFFVDSQNKIDFFLNRNKIYSLPRKQFISSMAISIDGSFIAIKDSTTIIILCSYAKFNQ